MTVSRCVCYDISFEELKERSKENNLSFDELQQTTGCSTGCGMCEPYVRLMLNTGQTSFQPLPPHEADQILKEAAEDAR